MEGVAGGLEETCFWLFNVVGPVAIYAPQFLLMARRGSVGSFSKLTCYFLITAHCLRLIFRLSVSFHPSLLAQSLLVLLVQSALLLACLRLELGADKAAPGRGPGATLARQLALIVMPVSAWGLFYCLFPRPGLSALTGALSAFFEGLLPLPQIASNLRRRSVEGVSLLMVVLWLLGDLGKFCIFVASQQPLQFIVGAAVLVALDSVVLAQFALYRDRAATGGVESERLAAASRHSAFGKSDL